MKNTHKKNSFFYPYYKIIWYSLILLSVSLISYDYYFEEEYCYADTISVKNIITGQCTTYANSCDVPLGIWHLRNAPECQSVVVRLYLNADVDVLSSLGEDLRNTALLHQVEIETNEQFTETYDISYKFISYKPELFSQQRRQLVLSLNQILERYRDNITVSCMPSNDREPCVTR